MSDIDGDEPTQPDEPNDPGGPDQPDPQTPDPGFDSEESSSLGLTEEFARIEAEIESEAETPSPAEEGAGPEPKEHEDAEEPLEPVAEEPLEPVAEEFEDEPDDSDAGEDEPEELGDEGEDEDEEELEDGDDPDEGFHEPVDEDTAIHAPAGTHPVLPAESAAPADPPRVSPMPAAVPIAASAEEVPKPKVPRLWLRFVTGSLLIVLAAASAVAGGGLFFFTDIADSLQPIPGIQDKLDEVEGEAQTILIIGSDRRAETGKTDRRSDTTMLLRVDPENQILSLFSLPRDLKVQIPGYSVDKLNAAYSIGGEKLTLETVKQLTGLEFNHVVEINFDGFADAVDAIECVYVDVDREYFNDNSNAVDGGYAEIDINAGYQRLCGLKALQYVRYRHLDTDLVRAARQQDFVREARQKVDPQELAGAVIGLGKGSELIEIFTEHTRSDISDAGQVVEILKSFVAVRDAAVNEVHFEGNIGDEVTASDKQVKTAVEKFYNGVASSGQRGGEDAAKDEDPEQKDKTKKKDKKNKEKEKDPRDDATVVPTETLADESSVKFANQAEHFKADAEKVVRRLGIPAFYPTKVVPGSQFNTDSRTYEYENEDNKRESAYKTVIALETPSTLTQYYGVMGTTWDDPPILRNPSETREIKGREYLLFYDGGRLRLVGWKQDGNSYWLNNTLTQNVSQGDMLEIAATMGEV